MEEENRFENRAMEQLRSAACEDNVDGLGDVGCFGDFVFMR